MSEAAWLTLYCALILLISLCGGGLPFLGRVTHHRMQFYLTASAGVMLGAAFFHVMPEAAELSGEYFGLWMSVSVVGLFCIERFVAPHSHEVDGGHAHAHHPHHHPEQEACPHGPEGHGEPAAAPAGKERHRVAAPSMAGWAAVLGLTIHTFMNGVGLAGAVDVAVHELGSGAVLVPGLGMFLAIFLHKPADALAISVVLSRKGVGRGKLTLVQLGFALMVPVGVVAYCLAKKQITEGMEGQLAGAALAFSAGTFLFIALSDLLPEVQFHRHDRVPLFLTLVAGVVLMGGIAYLEEHHHGGHSHGAHSHGAPEKHGGHPADDHDDDADEHHPGHRH